MICFITTRPDSNGIVDSSLEIHWTILEKLRNSPNKGCQNEDLTD
jgi:hypothetical protein